MLQSDTAKEVTQSLSSADTVSYSLFIFLLLLSPYSGKTNPFLPALVSIAVNGTTIHPDVETESLGVTLPAFPWYSIHLWVWSTLLPRKIYFSQS